MIIKCYYCLLFFNYYSKVNQCLKDCRITEYYNNKCINNEDNEVIVVH